MPADTPRQALVITVLNLKGGVGKTHATWLLSSVCEERGLRCLYIDTDTQGNLSNSFARDRGTASGVERLLDPSADADVRDLIHRTVYPHIDVIPSNPLLARFDLSDAQSWEKSDLQLAFVDPMNALSPLNDVIVFDCPPRLSLVSFDALCASDAVIVPLEAADWGGRRASCRWPRLSVMSANVTTSGCNCSGTLLIPAFNRPTVGYGVETA